MNSGVLLMRNTDWMRDLFNQMARYGTHPMDYAMEEVRRALPHSPHIAALIRVMQPCRISKPAPHHVYASGPR